MNHFQPTLIDSSVLSEPRASNWFAVHVRSNFEQTASSILRNKGYEEFLPTYRSKRRWSDRVKEQDLPLFPGYLFCQLDPYDRFPVLSTSGVVQIVGIGKTPIPVSDAEVEAIWRITHSDLVVDPWPYLEAGEAVILESGPLTGLQGILLECKNRRRLLVSVTLLQRSVAVEIDGADVRPVGGMDQLIARALRKVPVGITATAQMSRLA